MHSDKHFIHTTYYLYVQNRLPVSSKFWGRVFRIWGVGSIEILLLSTGYK